MIARKSSRRIRRRRVRASRESSPVSRRGRRLHGAPDQEAVDDDREQDGDDDRDRRRDLVAVALPEALVHARPPTCGGAVFRLDDPRRLPGRPRDPGRARAAVAARCASAVPAEVERRAPGGGPSRRDGLLPRARPRGTRRGLAGRAARALRRDRLAKARHRDHGRRAGRGDPLLPPIRTPSPALRRAARPRPAAGRASPTGTARCRGSSSAAGSASCSTGRSPRPRPARASRTRRSSSRRSSWPAASRTEALHVGDTAEEDVDGARAAGIRPLLIDREGTAATSPRSRRSISISERESRSASRRRLLRPGLARVRRLLAPRPRGAARQRRPGSSSL